MFFKIPQGARSKVRLQHEKWAIYPSQAQSPRGFTGKRNKLEKESIARPGAAAGLGTLAYLNGSFSSPSSFPYPPSPPPTAFYNFKPSSLDETDKHIDTLKDSSNNFWGWKKNMYDWTQSNQHEAADPLFDYWYLFKK